MYREALSVMLSLFGMVLWLCYASAVQSSHKHAGIRILLPFCPALKMHRKHRIYMQGGAPFPSVSAHNEKDALHQLHRQGGSILPYTPEMLTMESLRKCMLYCSSDFAALSLLSSADHNPKE
jgi:hypothetical protein